MVKAANVVARRQGVHRRGLRHRHGPRRRRRREGRDRRRRRGCAARRASWSPCTSSRARTPRSSAFCPKARSPWRRDGSRRPWPPSPRPDRPRPRLHAEARRWPAGARQAGAALAEFSQEQIDAIVDAMAAAVTPQAEALARLAVEETGFGVVADKIQKNLFASQKVYEFIRPMRTVGVVARHRRPQDRRDRRAVRRRRRGRALDQPDLDRHLQDPHRAQGALRDRHQPASVGGASASRRTAEVMAEAARRGRRARRRDQLDDDGHPRGHAGTDEAARGGGHPRDRRHGPRARGVQRRQARLRRRARATRPPTSSGPPTSARPSATSSPARRSTTACCARRRTRSSWTRPIADAGQARVRRRNGGYFLSTPEIDAVARVLVTPQRLPNPALVGKSATGDRRAGCGITVPAGTRVLIAPLDGVGRDYPLSIEKLCPVLSFYVVKDWREGCERCKQILRYGGMGHTMSIHSQNEQVILEFGLKKPAFRIVREHADDARVDRPDDRARPGHDARVRRLGRQHHLRQHLAAAPAEHQAARLRGRARERRTAGTRPAGQRGGGRAHPAEGPRPPCSRGHERRDAGEPDRRLPVGSRRDGRPRRSRGGCPGAGGSPGAGAFDGGRTVPRRRPREFVCEDDVRAAVRPGARSSSASGRSSRHPPGISARPRRCSPLQAGAA